MKRARAGALWGVAALLLAMGGLGCKRRLVEVGPTAYIIGPTNDIRPVQGGSDPDVSAVMLKGSVLITTRLADKRLKFCSGTLIAPAPGTHQFRILTNHHCLAKTGPDNKATRELLPEACQYTTAYFGFVPGQTKDAMTVPCQVGSLRTNFEGDLAVFALTQNPPAEYQPLTLWTGEDSPRDRDAVIVHYPDVEAQLETPATGGPRLPTAAVTVANCKVLGPFDPSEWVLDRTLPFSLRHTCDLIHGSSGSALIDKATGTIIGVNWGGIKITYQEGERVDNVATRASYVAAFLEGREQEMTSPTRSDTSNTPGGPASLGATQQSTQAEKPKKESLGQAIKRKACGVADGTHGGGMLLLLSFMLVPLVALRRASVR